MGSQYYLLQTNDRPGFPAISDIKGTLFGSLGLTDISLTAGLWVKVKKTDLLQNSKIGWVCFLCFCSIQNNSKVTAFVLDIRLAVNGNTPQTGGCLIKCVNGAHVVSAASQLYFYMIIGQVFQILQSFLVSKSENFLRCCSVEVKEATEGSPQKNINHINLVLQDSRRMTYSYIEQPMRRESLLGVSGNPQMRES